MNPPPAHKEPIYGDGQSYYTEFIKSLGDLHPDDILCNFRSIGCSALDFGYDPSEGPIDEWMSDELDDLNTYRKAFELLEEVRTTHARKRAATGTIPQTLQSQMLDALHAIEDPTCPPFDALMAVRIALAKATGTNVAITNSDAVDKIREASNA